MYSKDSGKTNQDIIKHRILSNSFVQDIQKTNKSSIDDSKCITKSSKDSSSTHQDSHWTSKDSISTNMVRVRTSKGSTSSSVLRLRARRLIESLRVRRLTTRCNHSGPSQARERGQSSRAPEKARDREWDTTQDTSKDLTFRTPSSTAKASDKMDIHMEWDPTHRTGIHSSMPAWLSKQSH